MALDNTGNQNSRAKGNLGKYNFDSDDSPVVKHDNTLQGDGTDGSLLGVKVPLTTAEKTKISQSLTSVSVDGTTVTGDGTPANPLKATGGGSGGITEVIHDLTLTGKGTAVSPLSVPGGDSGYTIEEAEIGFSGNDVSMRNVPMFNDTDFANLKEDQFLDVQYNDGVWERFFIPYDDMDTIYSQRLNAGYFIIDTGFLPGNNLFLPIPKYVFENKVNCNLKYRYITLDGIIFPSGVLRINTRSSFTLCTHVGNASVCVDGTTVKGDGTRQNPLNAITTDVRVETDTTLNGDGTSTNKLGISTPVVNKINSALQKVTCTDGSLFGDGTPTNPISVVVNPSGLTAVAHDGTLTGDGTITNKLSVVGGGGGMTEVKHDDTLTGKGITGDLLSVAGIGGTISHDDSLKGAGTQSDPLTVYGFRQYFSGDFSISYVPATGLLNVPALVDLYFAQNGSTQGFTFTMTSKTDLSLTYSVNVQATRTADNTISWVATAITDTCPLRFVVLRPVDVENHFNLIPINWDGNAINNTGLWSFEYKQLNFKASGALRVSIVDKYLNGDFSSSAFSITQKNPSISEVVHDLTLGGRGTSASPLTVLDSGADLVGETVVFNYNDSGVPDKVLIVDDTRDFTYSFYLRNSMTPYTEITALFNHQLNKDDCCFSAMTHDDIGSVTFYVGVYKNSKFYIIFPYNEYLNTVVYIPPQHGSWTAIYYDPNSSDFGPNTNHDIQYGVAISGNNIHGLGTMTNPLTVNSIDHVVHDETLDGAGTYEDPLTVLGGGGGGLSQVYHNDSLQGKGTESEPLRVAESSGLAHDESLYGIGTDDNRLRLYEKPIIFVPDYEFSYYSGQLYNSKAIRLYFTGTEKCGFKVKMRNKMDSSKDYEFNVMIYWMNPNIQGDAVAISGRYPIFISFCYIPNDVSWAQNEIFLIPFPFDHGVSIQEYDWEMTVLRLREPISNVSISVTSISGSLESMAVKRLQFGAPGEISHDSSIYGVGNSVSPLSLATGGWRFKTGDNPSISGMFFFGQSGIFVSASNTFTVFFQSPGANFTAILKFFDTKKDIRNDIEFKLVGICDGDSSNPTFTFYCTSPNNKAPGKITMIHSDDWIFQFVPLDWDKTSRVTMQYLIEYSVMEQKSCLFAIDEFETFDPSSVNTVKADVFNPYAVTPNYKFFGDRSTGIDTIRYNGSWNDIYLSHADFRQEDYAYRNMNIYYGVNGNGDFTASSILRFKIGSQDTGNVAVYRLFLYDEDMNYTYIPPAPQEYYVYMTSLKEDVKVYSNGVNVFYYPYFVYMKRGGAEDGYRYLVVANGTSLINTSMPLMRATIIKPDDHYDWQVESFNMTNQSYVMLEKTFIKTKYPTFTTIDDDKTPLEELNTKKNN